MGYIHPFVVVYGMDQVIIVSVLYIVITLTLVACTREKKVRACFKHSCGRALSIPHSIQGTACVIIILIISIDFVFHFV